MTVEFVVEALDIVQNYENYPYIPRVGEIVVLNGSNFAVTQVYYYPDKDVVMVLADFTEEAKRYMKNQ